MRLHTGVVMTAYVCLLAVTIAHPPSLLAVPATPGPGTHREAVSQAPGAVEPDQDVKVSLRAVGEPLVHLFRDLSREAEPELVARAGLGERRVHVFVSEMPRPRLHQALGRVVRGLWYRRASGRQLWLEPDPSAPREARESLEAQKGRLFAGLRALVRSLSLDRESVARLAKTDPAAAGCLTRPSSRAAVRLLGLLNEAQWRELQATGRLRLTPAELGPSGASLVRAYAERIAEQRAELRKQLPPGSQALGTVSADELAQGVLELRADGEPGVDELFTHLAVHLRTEKQATGAVLYGPGGAHRPSPRWPGERPTPQRASLPQTNVTLRFEAPPRAWGEVLRQVAVQLGLPIVSEEYTRTRPPYPPVSTVTVAPLPEVLDRLCAAFGYQWRNQGGIYEFRSASWYFDEEQEPAGTLVKTAQTARARKQRLSIDWLAAAATSARSYPQRRRLASHVPGVDTLLVRFQPLLQLHASLSPAQRAALESKDGLPAAALSTSQRELLATTRLRILRERPDSTGSAARIRLVREPSSARFTFAEKGRSTEAVIALP